MKETKLLQHTNKIIDLQFDTICVYLDVSCIIITFIRVRRLEKAGEKGALKGDGEKGFGPSDAP